MIIKPKPNSYYSDQNARSGTGANANTLWKDLQNAGITFNSSWSVLDIGCRTGITLNNLWKQGCKNVWGIDIGELARGHWQKQNYPFIGNLFWQDVHKVDLTENYFDLITISHTLEHLYDPNQVLIQMKDSLKVGGLIHSIVPIEPEKDFEKYNPHLVRFETPEDHCKFYTDAGLELVHSEFRHGNSIVIVKK